MPAPAAVAVLLALLAPAAVACGGSRARGEGTARSAAQGAQVPAHATGAAAAGGESGGAAGASAPASPAVGEAAARDAAAGEAGTGEAGAGTSTAPGAPPPSPHPSRAVPSGLPDDAPLTVRVLSECVVPGGTQRVVVDTLPDAYLAYDNLYADSRDGAVHGGIDGQARSDARGHFEASWVVSRTAPVGDVRLDVGASAQGRGSVRMVFYRVSRSCP